MRLVPPLAAALFLLAAGCSEYGVRPSIDEGGDPVDDDFDVWPGSHGFDDEEQPREKSCAEDATLLTTQMTADATKECPWGIGDNLERLNEYNQARIVERWEVPIPPGATLCSISFRSVQDSLTFDDHITLTLDDNVLLGGGSGYPIDRLDAIDGVPQWDWTRIVGTHFAERDDPYFCLGDSGPCEVPQTETPGPFEVAFELAGAAEDLIPDGIMPFEA